MKQPIPNYGFSKEFPKSHDGHTIIVMQSPYSRALNVGYVQTSATDKKFVPGRLNLGAARELDTYQATIESCNMPEIQTILNKYQPDHISTITLLRETLSCRIGSALYEAGIRMHYGDAFIGTTHIKGEGEIKTAYLYENIEGLRAGGLWILADSICMGRNTGATLDQLFGKIKPDELIVLAPIASRVGIDEIGAKIAKHGIHATFIAWGGLFGVDEKTRYDMPWGHKNTEALDKRDQDLMIKTYGTNICMGGDFGNDYYCPTLALSLYYEQLKEHKVTPQIPMADEIMSLYHEDEIIVR